MAGIAVRVKGVTAVVEEDSNGGFRAVALDADSREIDVSWLDAEDAESAENVMSDLLAEIPETESISGDFSEYEVPFEEYCHLLR